MGVLHCFDVGCGDASVIVTDSAAILIDCHDISEHSQHLPSGKLIEAVFITHQHYDHYSGLEYLREKKYKIKYLIYSPYERRYGDASVTLEEWKEFSAHRAHFEGQGTKLYKPFKQNDAFKEPYWKPDGLKFWMLGPNKSTATSETRQLHDACLVFRADMGKMKCTFTGDASDANLEDVATIDHICDDVLHASHHGSIEGANLDFIKKCNPRWTVISTACGKYDNVPHPTAVKRYQDNSTAGIWRTDIDGGCEFKF